MNKRVLLVNFYSPKSLGLRYLEKSLEMAGFDVWVLYFKGFHSTHPKKPSSVEVAHMLSLVEKHDPLFIGFSVMSSLYLEVVENISKKVRAASSAPLVWGGVYATIFPEKCLNHCDYVLRGEGEGAIADFAKKLSAGENLDNMENLAYISEGETVVNPVRKLAYELDKLEIAKLGLSNKYFIDSDKLYNMDPQLKSYSYETSCSRGCPFACAYCTTVNLKQIYRDNSHYLRFRSVPLVIQELKEAKSQMKRLVMIHFWDEIFSDDPAWIDEFCESYKKEIGLPFNIWGHPAKTDINLISKLRKAGLYQVTMGIQSGSPKVRRDAFNRAGSQEQILQAAEAFVKAKVPWVTYDFILRHPFESVLQIKETYEFCASLPGKFTLNIHDLNFLPGTNITKAAIKQGFYTEEEMEKIMYAPMETQYASWWESGSNNPEINFWYYLTFLTQFSTLKGSAKKLAKKGPTDKAQKKASRLYKIGKKMAKFKHYWLKGRAVIIAKLF